MYRTQFSQLQRELLLSYSKLKEANDTLKQLQSQKNKAIPSELTSSISDLELTHKLCVEDITRHKEEIKKLTSKLQEGEKKIKQLKNENERLREIQKKKNSKILNKDDLKIKNTNQLSEILGLKSKKSKEIENDIKIRFNPENQNFLKNKESFIKRKSELEKKFKELKDKINRFNETIEEQDKIITDHKNFLNDVNQNMNIYNEGINISIHNSVMNEDNELQKKSDEIYQQLEIVSISLVNMDDILLNIKNTFVKNLENILKNIYDEFNELNLEENQNEFNFWNIEQKIIKEMQEIQKIFEQFWKDHDNFYEKNINVEEDMNKLKYLYKKYGEECQKKREQSRMNALKEELKISQNDQQQIDNPNFNNNLNIKDMNDYNNYLNLIKDQSSKEFGLGESFTLKIPSNKSKEKEDLYKTINIFKETEEDKLLEQYIEEAQLLRKNYHMICYIHDEFDVYDIYYDLKAVGLRYGQFFPKCSQGFNYGNDIEIISFTINGEESPFIQKHHSIEFQINLSNKQSLKVHILYKSTINKLFLTQNELKERNIYRTERYGIDKSLSGQKAKFSLILKGSFDIVNFSEYFLIRNKNNKKEVEYMWGGIVPYGGRTTRVMLSKKEATWSFNYTVTLHSNSNLRNTMLYVPIEFIGGNNEIININSSCKQSTNIVLEEEQRQYAIEFFNTNYKEGTFNIEGILKNKCKGEWEIDLTDERIEQLMPQEDVLCKEQLKTFAKKIIADFDEKNKNNDFVFHDYMKIGFWVNDNIKYDLDFSGKLEYSAVDIYNLKKGVCHHFTRLANALLYSLGYKVLYAAGYTCKGNNSFKTSTGHAWSLIKLSDNKWYPFDATWGIFTGKLPVSHIFSCFDGKHIKTHGHDHVTIDKHELEGTFMQ